METLKVNDIVVLKPEEVSNVKPHARPWFEGPYVVSKVGFKVLPQESVEVASLRDGKLLLWRFDELRLLYSLHGPVRRGHFRRSRQVCSN